MKEVLLGVGLVVAVVIGLALVRLVLPRVSLPVLSAIAILMAVAVPRSVVELVPHTSDVFSTLGPPVPTVTTYGAVVAGCLIAFLLERRHVPVPAMYYVFIACVAVGLWTVWEGSALQWSGLIALALGVLAWAFGRVVGREIFANNASARYLMIAMAGILTLQLGVSAAQLLGLEVPSWLTGTDRTLEGLIGRASGTVGHPANLAKIAFITCLIALPFTLSKGRKVRFWAWTVVGLGLVTSGLTISRANLAAHFLLIGLWIVTLPGKARFMVRLASGVALAVLALIFLPPLLERFEMDETGGQRPVLLDAAWMQLSQNLWTGTGPNSYISVVGGFDAATASGLPVHNAFLLYTAELGLTLAVVFYAPILLLLLRSLRRAGRRGSQLSAAKVLVFALPGYLMITLTGWSLMANFSLVATMLTFGILDAAVPKRGTQRSERRAREDSHGASPMSEESSRANEDHGKRMAAL